MIWWTVCVSQQLGVCQIEDKSRLAGYIGTEVYAPVADKE
jgi:hypothetical protein